MYTHNTNMYNPFQDYEELIIKRVAEFEKRLVQTPPTGLLIFKFPDNYNCYDNEMIKSIHLYYADTIKHNLMTKGYDVTSMDYKDEYINYNNCYTSKAVYLID